MDVIYRNLNRGNCFSLASGTKTRDGYASKGKVREYVTSGCLSDICTNNPKSIKNGASSVMAKGQRSVFAWLGGTWHSEPISIGKLKLVGRLSIDFKIGAFIIDNTVYIPNNKHIAIIEDGSMFIYTK